MSHQGTQCYPGKQLHVTGIPNILPKGAASPHQLIIGIDQATQARVFRSEPVARTCIMFGKGEMASARNLSIQYIDIS